MSIKKMQNSKNNEAANGRLRDLKFLPGKLLAGDVPIRLPDYVARLCTNDYVRTHNTYLYLFPVADLSNSLRIVSKRILAPKLLGDTSECGISVCYRIS